LYRYNGDPLIPETRNISLFHNLKIFEFVDIPNIGHPYYMVRGYYANGTYADSNIVDVELGEIPMFINPQYKIEGESVSFSVWCKENPGVGDIFLLYRFRKEGDDWKCFEDMPGGRSPHADSSSVMANNWTRYEWSSKEVEYSTYVWFNFYHLGKNVYWVPDRYANGTFNYEHWGRTEPVYVFKSSIFQFIYLFMFVFAQVFIGLSIYLDFRYGKKARIIAYLFPILIISVFYLYIELSLAAHSGLFEMNLFGHYVDIYSERLTLNNMLPAFGIFSLCQWVGLMPFIVRKVENLEMLKKLFKKEYGEKRLIKRGINLILFQREIAWGSAFFTINSCLILLIFLPDFRIYTVSIITYIRIYTVSIITYIALIIEWNMICILNRINSESFEKSVFIFFNKIEKVDNFNHFWGEINEYYENCKRAFKLYRKMLVPIFTIFFALFISNYMLFHNWTLLMSST
ncbi:MAG: hypothetical protein ACTSRZ_08190, partial [Promethearchaeota archaeon]